MTKECSLVNGIQYTVAIGDLNRLEEEGSGCQDIIVGEFSKST